MSRKKDDSNILSLGCRVVGEKTGMLITDAFLKTKFEGDREAFNKRQEKIKEIEEKYLKA